MPVSWNSRYARTLRRPRLARGGTGRFAARRSTWKSKRGVGSVSRKTTYRKRSFAPRRYQKATSRWVSKRGRLGRRGFRKSSNSSQVNQLTTGSSYYARSGHREASLSAAMHRKVAAMLTPKFLYRSQKPILMADLAGGFWGQVYSIPLASISLLNGIYGTIEGNNPRATELILTGYTNPTSFTTTSNPPLNVSQRRTPLLVHRVGLDITFTNSGNSVDHFEFYVFYPKKPVPWNVGTTDPVTTLLSDKWGQPAFGHASNDNITGSGFALDTATLGFAQQNNKLIDFQRFNMYYGVAKKQVFSVSPGCSFTVKYTYCPTKKSISLQELLDNNQQIEQYPKLSRCAFIRHWCPKVAYDTASGTSLTTGVQQDTIRGVVTSEYLFQQGWANETRNLVTSAVAPTATAGGSAGTAQFQEDTGAGQYQIVI